MEISGHKINNWWIIGGGGAAVAVWYFYKNASNNSSTSSSSDSATSASSTDPVTGLPYSEDNQIDPLTGMTYLQEAQEYGSVSAAESEVSEDGYTAEGGYGADEYGAVDSGYPTLYEGDTSTNDTTSFSTNAAWAQAVTSGLASLGYSSTSISAALGLFFAGLPLSAADASIVEAAEAEYGPPPQGTYNIIPEPSTGSGTGTTGTGTGTGTTTEKPGGVTDITVEAKNGTATVSWRPPQYDSKAGEATTYNVGISPAPKGGASGSHDIGSRTSYKISGIQKGTTYKVTVSAANSAGTGPSETHSFKE